MHSEQHLGPMVYIDGAVRSKEDDPDRYVIEHGLQPVPLRIELGDDLLPLDLARSALRDVADEHVGPLDALLVAERGGGDLHRQPRSAFAAEGDLTPAAPGPLPLRQHLREARIRDVEERLLVHREQLLLRVPEQARARAVGHGDAAVRLQEEDGVQAAVEQGVIAGLGLAEGGELRGGVLGLDA